MNYEVFGKVQKVFMRKYTKKCAIALKITGCVYNTEEKTLKGEACGTRLQLQEFQVWLSTKGSPKSFIDHAEFTPLVDVVIDPFHGKFLIKKVQMTNGTSWA